MIFRGILSQLLDFFYDDCLIYRKITNKGDIEMLQKDLDKLGEWAAENAMKINPSKSKAVCFTRSRVKDPLDYSLANTLIPETSSCKYQEYSYAATSVGRMKSTTR